ncbi:MAG: hypothetical protein WD341_08185 [Tistlia sp.]|uniref:hypothetical protein n=1 Tax=Tistlia sp. TaxID=3057121 RepID=UPI0034A136E5
MRALALGTGGAWRGLSSAAAVAALDRLLLGAAGGGLAVAVARAGELPEPAVLREALVPPGGGGGGGGATRAAVVGESLLRPVLESTAESLVRAGRAAGVEERSETGGLGGASPIRAGWSATWLCRWLATGGAGGWGALAMTGGAICGVGRTDW